jgi:hypothetical protein
LAATAGAVAADPREVFERRIKPILQSPNPSSCTQCHLAGVDLKDYLRPSPDETFRSLRDQGLIDLDRPKDSKILHLIQMGAGDTAGTALIHEKTRRAEYEAFAAWIEAAASDPKLHDLPKLAAEQLARPARPDAVIRHARTDRFLESFERNVWAWRFRCMNCHTEGTPQNDKLRAKHGDRVAWVKRDGAEATMRYLLGSPLIDAKAPEKSLLLLKPLGEVEHGGGKKFLPGDQGYKGFRAWLEDYAAIVGGRYVMAADLPPKEAGPERFGSDVWLKLAETPPAWADKFLQVNVYAWDDAKQTWEAEPIATSDRGVWGKGRLWQHNLTLLAEPGSERARAWRTGKPSLPRGRYLVKVYVDAGGRIAGDWKATLGENDSVGQVEVTSAWPEGNGKMTVVAAGRVNK